MLLYMESSRAASRHEGADPALVHLYASVGKLISSSLDLEQVLDGVMEEVRRFFHPSNWSLMRLDPSTDELFFVRADGIDFERIRDVRLSAGEGIAGYVVEHGEAVFVPDATNDERFSKRVDEQTGFITRSVMAVPLVFQGRCHGVIELINRFDGGGFSEQDLVVLQTIADFAAIAFANATLYAATRDLAYRDPLTGVLNRARLDGLRAEWSGRRSDERICAVAVLDLNDFKLINDTHGHRAGDRALRFLSEHLQILIRGSDRIFRMGGDEFLILIHGSDAQRLPRILDRLETALRYLQRKTEAFAPPFSFSFGLSSGSIQELDEVIHQADLDMYSRKKNAGMQSPPPESVDP